MIAGLLRNRAVLVALLFAPVVEAGEPAPANAVGFVLDVTGLWTVDAGSTDGLRAGQAIPAGSTIRARSPQQRWRIVVALSDGTTVKRICDQAVATCGEPLVLPSATQKQTSSWRRALAAASALFGHPSERYASTMSRGTGAEDGVARLDVDAVDLNELLAGLPAGAYSLTLRALGSEASPITGLSFQAPAGGPVRTAGLSRGLYELVVTPRADVEGASEAWVLLVEPSAFVVAHDAYQTASHGWESDARPQAMRSFRRAYLETLANQLTTGIGSGENSR